MKTSITNVLTEANKLFGNTYGIDLDTDGFTTAVDDIIAQIGRITTALGEIDYSKLPIGGDGGNGGNGKKTPKPNNDLNKLLSEAKGLYYIDANGNRNKHAEVDLSSKLTVTNNKIRGSYNEQNVYQIKGNSLTGNEIVGAQIIKASKDRKVYKNTKVGDSSGWTIPKGSYAIITGEVTNNAHTKYTQLKFLDENGELKTAYYQTSRLSRFDTGGYTGNWNSKEGRMAMLHEKELVLNAKDTKNILAAVNSVRAMQSIITSLDLNALAVKKQMISNLTSPIVAKEGLTNNNLDQNVQIEANFPNVRDARQIEEAFDNLVNMASQYANKQTR